MSPSRDIYIYTHAAPTVAGSVGSIWPDNVWLLIDVGGGGRLFDEPGRFLRVRHVGHMARLHFDRLGLSALRYHAFLIRIDRPVFGGHHVPGGLVLPRGIRHLMGERVGGDRHLRSS